MARVSTQTVFGFGCSLDWRPTSFVPAFPSTRVCSACGLVPPATATLPCRHLLCEPCYKGRGGNRCPLDKEPFQEEDVVWSSRIGKDCLLSRKVRCWNVDSDCNAEGPASDMLGHFTNVCRFHVVSCPRCCGKVPHLQMTDHLESCRTPPNLPEQPALDDNFVNSALEVREALRDISEKCASVESKLKSFEQRLPSFRDDSIAKLSPILAQTVRGAIESATETCRVETGDLLAEHRHRVVSEIEEGLIERERSKAALRGISEKCTSIESKLDSFEARLPSFRDDSIAKLSAIFAQTVTSTIESAFETCRVETGALLAEHRHVLVSDIEETLVERERSTVAAVTQECNRIAESVNSNAAGQTSTEAQNEGRTAPSSSAHARLISDASRKITKCREKLMKKESLSGKEAAKLLEMLALSSLAVTNDALPYKNDC